MSEWHPKGTIVQGKTCPKCRRNPVVYNGNYFCGGWGDDCDWAMGEQNSEFNRDIVRTYLIQEREEAIAEGNAERVERMEFYLIDLETNGV